MIVQELHAIQERRRYLPAEEMDALARRLGVPLRRIHEVASFFPHYRLTPPAAVEVAVCRDMACHLRGSDAWVEALRRDAIGAGASGLAVGEVSCLGLCDRAPAVTLQGHPIAAPTLDACRALVRSCAAGATEAPPIWDTLADTQGWSIDPYEGGEPYGGLRQLVASGSADGLLAEMKTADLRGMGGAGVLGLPEVDATSARRSPASRSIRRLQRRRERARHVQGPRACSF